MFESGKGVGQDFEKAARYYRQAADLGDSKAQFNMGELIFDEYSVVYIGTSRYLLQRRSWCFAE